MDLSLLTYLRVLPKFARFFCLCCHVTGLIGCFVSTCFAHWEANPVAIVRNGSRASMHKIIGYHPAFNSHVAFH